MLKIMAFPDLDDKFVRALGDSVSPHHLYRKSGEYRGSYSDSVLVWNGARRRYILVAMVEDAQGETILRQLLPAMEQILSCH
jgi:beta-lactamase class A